MKLSPIDRARIRAESGCAEETIKAYPHVRDASKRRIEHAAMALGIALPTKNDGVNLPHTAA